MKQKLFSIFIILVFFGQVSPADGAQKQKKAPSEPFIAMAPTRRVGSAEIYYIAVNDETHVDVNNRTLRRVGADAVVLNVGFRTQGRTITRPDYILVNVVTSSPRPKFQPGSRLRLSCPGTGVVLEGDPAEPVKNERMAGGYLGDAYYWVPFDDFVNALKCQNLTLAIGTYSYPLSPEVIAALRDIEKTIEP